MPDSAPDTYATLDEFRPYETPRLLAIVGSNPLPAAVAATLLTAPGGEVILVCTGASRDVARELEKLLKVLAIPCEPVLQVDEADRYETGRLIRERLGTVPGRVGLNYTGGTKSMSVHIYRAVEAWAKDKAAPEPVFSYLDPRRRAMVFDPKPGETVSPQVPIPFIYPMRLRHLITMHGWQQTKLLTKPVLTGVADALLTLHGAEQHGGDPWKDWKKNFLRTQCYNGENVKNTLPPTLPLPDNADLRAVRSQLEEALSPSGSALAVASGQIVFQSVNACCGLPPREFCEFLDGKWLESSVLQALQRCKESHHLHDLGMSLEVDLRKNHNVDFELDDVALHGYQLFAFSCYSGTHKATLKKKLFEAYMRSQQIGGDEARVALVSPYDAPDDLRDEISGDIGKQGHIRVFGWRDLADLDASVSKWIGDEIKVVDRQ